MSENELHCDNCGATESDDLSLNIAADVFSYPGRIRVFCDDCVGWCDTCCESYRDYSDHLSRYCDYCDTYYCPDADYEYCEDCDEIRCTDCGPCTRCHSAIRQYSYRPHSYRPKGDFSNSVLMGLELEVDGDQSDIVDAVHKYDDDESHIYLKHDGSIDGVELVTHPMTLDWAMQYPFGDLVRTIENHGGRASNACGLHIHVSRNAFKRGSSHAMRWLMFLYRNAENITDYVARRESNQWAAWTKPRHRELFRKATGVHRGERYVAVNCNNGRTYELRFFASTLDETELLASLQFADASVEYTRALSAGDVAAGALRWHRFATWLIADDMHGGRYNELVDMLAGHESQGGLCGDHGDTGSSHCERCDWCERYGADDCAMRCDRTGDGAGDGADRAGDGAGDRAGDREAMGNVEWESVSHNCPLCDN